jgi:hypothetical protein
MEPRYDRMETYNMAATTVGAPPSDAQSAATAWWTARDRYHEALRAHGEAQKQLEAARQEEQKAWIALEHVAKQDAKIGTATATQIPQIPDPFRRF